MKHSLSILFLFFVALSFAQEKFTLSGYVKDAANGEELIGATVLVKELSGVGAATNVYGFYSLTLPKGNYTLSCQFIGYKPTERTISLTKDETITIELEEQQQELEDVVVTAERPDENVKEIKMSQTNLQIETIKSIPALFGEVDLFRSIQLLPGVQSAGEGTTGLFVRGGSSDQNLIQLDESTVYNASHFLGFFSVFNADAIKNVEIYKGGIPAKFGGRLSSILDIQMKDGNSKQLSLSGGIGSISSRLTLEAPIIKDKASFIVSGRRTYADLFLRLSPNENINRNVLYFYDLNAKVNYKIGEKNRIFLSGYFGRDVLKFDQSFGINWGNATTTLRWNHIFNQKIFLNTTALFSNFDYGFDVKIGDEGDGFNWKSNLQEYALKLDFDYFLNPKNTITFGSNSIFHRFAPAEITQIGDFFIPDFKLENKYAVEQALYLGNEQTLTSKLSLQYGLRYSMFMNIGPGSVTQYTNGQPIDDEFITDTVTYRTLQGIKFYNGLEPRFAARYLVTDKNSIKFSYNRMLQYLQIASNSTAGSPVDRWIPADTYVKPLIGDQVAMGYFRNLFDNKLETSVEIYYKWMQNVVDFKPNADILLNNNIETEIFSGIGWAYGAEFLIRKKTGRLTGWIGYTLSRTRRKIAGINNGNPYNARYDRTHDISLVASYRLSQRWNFSGTWVYSTGAAVSLPVGRYEVDGQSVALYEDGQRNTGRMPAYHRLDLALNWDIGKDKPREGQKRKWKSSLNFSIYNVYARKNAFSIEFRDIINNDIYYDPKTDEPEINNRPGSVKTYLFSIVPAITYNFNF